MPPFAPLTLGTVQLGMSYGIANAGGQPGKEQAAEILAAALGSGFAFLDTAPAYGNSEETLGALLPAVAGAEVAQVVSKVTGGQDPADWGDQLEESLRRLGRPSLHSWLLHDENDFARIVTDTWALIYYLKNIGRITNFGVSCYTPAVAMKAVRMPLVNAVQVPGNVFDRRFLSDECLDAAHAGGAFVFVRSVFLQGLCLMEPDAVPPRLPGAVEGVTALRLHCQEAGLSPQAFCLHYVNHRLRGRAHSLVLGVDSDTQVRELVAAMNQPSPGVEVFEEWEKRWPKSPPEMINPSTWGVYR